MACRQLAHESRFVEIEAVSRRKDEGHAGHIRGRPTQKRADFDKSLWTGRILPPTVLCLLDGTPPHLRKRALSEKKFGAAGSVRQLTTRPNIGM